MPSYFITATGTNIGKTFIMCDMISELMAENKDVGAIKPLISGFDENDKSCDSYKIIQALGGGDIDDVSPWRYLKALSPDMAADIPIIFEDVVKFCRKSLQHEYNFIEGVGGVMVPINDKYTILDLIKAVDIPVILITGSYLGSLSHTLTSYNVLKNAGCTIDRIIINQSMENDVGIDNTKKSLKSFIKEDIQTYLFK